MSNFVSGLIIIAFLSGNYYRLAIRPDIRLGLLDVVMVVVWLLAILIRPKILFSRLFTHPLSRPLSVFILVALASLLLSGTPYGLPAFAAAGLYLFRFIIYSLAFIPLSLLITPKKSQKLLPILGLCFVFTGLVQYLFVPDVRYLAVSGWDPHFYRVVGTLLDPGYLGLLLLFTLLILIPNSVYFPLFHSFPWAVTYITFALTYSRSSFLSFIFGFGVLSFYKKSRKYFLSALLLISVTMVILPRVSDGEGVKLERTSTIRARIINWSNSFSIFMGHPFVGVGFNNYRYAHYKYGFTTGSNWLSSHAGAGADSSLLFVAATTGIIGLAAYVWYLLTLWQLSSGRTIFRAGLVALFIHSWFLNSLFYPFILFWLALWLNSLGTEGDQ